MFKNHFKPYVCEGDTIHCEIDGFDCIATLYRDDCNDRPDERQDGFYPSRDPASAGYVGAKCAANPQAFARARRKAERIMAAWKNDEWHYYGVAVTIRSNGVLLTGNYAHAVWGIEGNYPIGGKKRNNYFRVVANELLPEALNSAYYVLQGFINLPNKGE